MNSELFKMNINMQRHFGGIGGSVLKTGQLGIGLRLNKIDQADPLG